jgi:hypothetical protein
VFRYRGSSLAAWPGDWSFPSPGGAHGVLSALRRFDPAGGWRIISDHRRAHMPFAFMPSTRLIFVGLTFGRSSKWNNESKVRAVLIWTM